MQVLQGAATALAQSVRADAERGSDPGRLASREGELARLDLVPGKADAQGLGLVRAEELEHLIELRAFRLRWRLGVLLQGGHRVHVGFQERPACRLEAPRREAPCDD